LALPEEGCRSKIVAYADLVQAHAVCDYVGGLADRPVIIDVGAHNGAYALLLGGLMKSRGGGGQLIAVEPDPHNVSILRNNIQLNALADVVLVQECAVSDKACRAQLFSEGSQSRLLSGNGAELSSCLDIRVSTLRDIIQELTIQKVDLLLVDVEGAELPVLRGFPWDMMRPSMLLCEMHPYNWQEYGYTGADMSALIRELHYRCFDMYLREHSDFHDEAYIGPCLFVPDKTPRFP
jgi:FkbM family methyltransferase